jgi:hypothetical protein
MLTSSSLEEVPIRGADISAKCRILSRVRCADTRRKDYDTAPLFWRLALRAWTATQNKGVTRDDG